MRRIVWIYGLISGAIISLLMMLTIPFEHQIGYDHSLYVGYSTMVVAFLLVFFGIRSYRENYCGGRISFGKAFTVGILIALITCVCYVATWEVMYFKFMPDYLDNYAAYEAGKAKASGASAAAIQAQMARLQQMKELYNNPLYNAAMTFIEPFPVGLAMALISAAILRKRAPALAEQTAPAAG